MAVIFGLMIGVLVVIAVAFARILKTPGDIRARSQPHGTGEQDESGGQEGFSALTEGFGANGPGCGGIGPEVNPATGLPLIEGGGIDVGGNPLGTSSWPD